MVNETTAKGVVLGATGASAILVSLSDLAAGRPPSVRVAVGATLAAAMLYALAGPAPKIATGFALIMFTGAALTNGVEAARIINKALGQN